MFKYFQLGTKAVLLLAILGATLPMSAFAQNKPAAGGAISIGSVEVQRVFNEYKVTQTSRAEIDKLGGTLDKALSQLQSNSAAFLTDAEINELAKLYTKDTALTDADKNRVTELEGKARKAGDELRNLQNVAAPNPQQSARLTELTSGQQRGTNTLTGLQTEYQKRLQDRQEALTKTTLDAIKAMIVKVAQEKNLAVVFDSAVAIYTANDITNDVIKQLNK